jgi:hypothetical protein
MALPTPKTLDVKRDLRPSSPLDVAPSFRVADNSPVPTHSRQEALAITRLASFVLTPRSRLAGLATSDRPPALALGNSRLLSGA